MKKLSVLALAALAAVSAPSFAAEGAGAFVRAEAGYSRATTKVVINSSHENDYDNAYGIRGGYYFNQYFGAELGYTNYYNDNNRDTGDISAKGYSLGLFGKTHFSDKNTGFYVDGRIGLARTSIDADLPSPALPRTETVRTRAYAGAGVGYDFNEHFGLDLNYLYHDRVLAQPGNELKFDTLTLGAEYRF